MILSEAAVLSKVRVAASRTGARLWRNNVGVAMDDNGRVVRFGLANDSSRVNRITKSSDLVGITPQVVTQDMVGTTVGIFTARECKREGWVYRGTPTERAQRAFLDLINEMGGDAEFTTGELL